MPTLGYPLDTRFKRDHGPILRNTLPPTVTYPQGYQQAYPQVVRTLIHRLINNPLALWVFLCYVACARLDEWRVRRLEHEPNLNDP